MGPKQATDLDQRIGAEIRRRRTEAGMSQTTLAERLGVTFQQVQKYERGKNRIAASRLYEVAGVFGAPVEVFFAEGAAS